MKTISLDRSSKTVRFARSWGKWDYLEYPDICSFGRRLVWGAIRLISLIIFLIVCYLVTALSIFSVTLEALKVEPNIWFYLYGIISPVLLVSVAAAVVGIFWYTGTFIKEKYSVWEYSRYLKPVEKETSPLVEAYKSWKGKYCAKVELIHK